MKYKQMLKIRETEKDPQVRDRILLNVLVKRDGMSVTGAARLLGMAPSWGVKWHNRYLKEGIAGLQTRTRSGRPPRISGEALKAVKKKVKKTVYLTAEDLRDIIRGGSGIECMAEYAIPYARFLLRSWGFARKVPMGRHVKRASRQKIAWFRKKLGPLIEGRMRAGYARYACRTRRYAWPTRGSGRASTRPRGSAASTRTRDRTPRPSCSA